MELDNINLDNLINYLLAGNEQPRTGMELDAAGIVNSMTEKDYIDQLREQVGSQMTANEYERMKNYAGVGQGPQSLQDYGMQMGGQLTPNEYEMMRNNSGDIDGGSMMLPNVQQAAPQAAPQVTPMQQPTRPGFYEQSGRTPFDGYVGDGGNNIDSVINSIGSDPKALDLMKKKVIESMKGS